MESPLEILSRAAGMVTTHNKRKLEEEQDDEQPLDFSCKKKRVESLEPQSTELLPPQIPLPHHPLLLRPSVIHHPEKLPPLPQKKRLHPLPLSRIGSPNSSSDESSNSPTAGKSRKLIKRRQISRDRGSRIEEKSGRKNIQVDKSRRVVVICKSGDVGDGVEEHFRRSLEKYQQKEGENDKEKQNGVVAAVGVPVVKPPTPTTTPSLPVAPEKKEDEEAEDSDDLLKPTSVDDHFAKALGSETWKLIKKE